MDMLRAVQKSSSLYKEEMSKVKAMFVVSQQEKDHHEKLEVEKKKLLEQEKELMLKYKTLQSEQKTARMLLEEANQRLENSLSKGDFTDLQAAYALSKTGTEKIKLIDEEMTKVMENISAIQQKRTHAEREQSKKKKTSVSEQLVIEDDE